VEFVGVLEPLNPPTPEVSGESGDEAITFRLGRDSDCHFNLWPDRFVNAAPYEREGIAIETRDGVVTVAVPSRAWID
jgi:hypothetical protein